MDLKNLQQDRFLRKDANQSDQTKGGVYTAANPAPKRGDDQFRKLGRPKGSEEDDGAPNVLTGTVITSCFIQTSALPSRIELEGNDITFFDDTYAQDGRVIGDTSRIVFTNASGKSGGTITQGFIMEKRASVYNTYDNVLSWFAVPAAFGGHNYMFIGRSATLGDPNLNVDAIVFNINRDTNVPDPTSPLPDSEGYKAINGMFKIEYSEDGVGGANYAPFFAGNSKLLSPSFSGFSSYMQAGAGGITGLAYRTATDPFAPNILLYLKSPNEVTLGASLIPDANNAYDIGSSSFKIKDLYIAGTFAGGAITGTTITASTSLGVGTRTWTIGAGSPEGVVTAPIGSLYSNTSGGASTTLYVKTSGAGNTGWTAK